MKVPSLPFKEATAVKGHTREIRKANIRAPVGQANKAKAIRATKETSVATEVATNPVPLVTGEVEAAAGVATSHPAAILTPGQMPHPIEVSVPLPV